MIKQAAIFVGSVGLKKKEEKTVFQFTIVY